MKVLVINAGSSSLKYVLFEMSTEKALLSGHIDGIGMERCVLKIKNASSSMEYAIKVKDHVDSIMVALRSLKEHKVIKEYSEISAIGHRVVHGGESYSKPTIITEPVIKKIEELSELAPLHNPANLAGIIACKKILPKVPQIAVFDTAFHQTMEKEDYLYALPQALYKKYKIRRYGFHGPSHKYVSEQAIKLLGKNEVTGAKASNDTKIISCHLGNGASITAIKNKKSVINSMGFTPLEGLIMGTRSGDIDPGLLFFLERKGFSINEMDGILNKESGLLGISGITSDVRDLQKQKLKGSKQAKLALDMFARKVAFYIGGYTALLNGVDCIVFTAGIGEGGWFVRKPICDYLSHLGVKLDLNANKSNQIIVSSPLSKVKVFVIPTNEELEIARETNLLIGK